MGSKNILICIKQVLDSRTVKFDKEMKSIIRDGMEGIINPLDCVALEAALEIKNKEGANITVITMGPPQSETSLREALAFGADKAILISDPAFQGSDTLATSRVLASAIKKLDVFPDLVLCGMQTTDSETGHVGPQLSEELDLPHVFGVEEIHIENNDFIVKHPSDDGYLETIKGSLPVVLAVTHELCVIRDLPLGSLEAAFTHNNVILWDAKDLGLKEDDVGFQGSATQVLNLYAPSPKRKGELIEGNSKILLEAFMKKLDELSVLDEENENQQ